MTLGLGDTGPPPFHGILAPLAAPFLLMASIAGAAHIDFSTHLVFQTETNGACDAFAADLDGDGDLDVLSASLLDNKIAWYENLTAAPDDRPGVFSVQRVISDSAVGAKSIHAADLDGDGDLDVLAAAYRDGNIAWYENLSAAPDNSPGGFSPQRFIGAEAARADSVYAADLDGDGDLDVLSASVSDARIAWYENLGAAPDSSPGTFASQQLIATAGAESVFAADLDGDGDMDVLSGSGAVAWHENLTAAPDNDPGSFATPKALSTGISRVTSVYAADLDGDGDMDVLSAFWGLDTISWYENLAAAPDSDPGAFSTEQVITSTARWARFVRAADLDLDGDLDVMSASEGDDKIAWYENLTAAPDNIPGAFGAQQVITTAAAYAKAVRAADLDGDGDLDVLSASVVDDRIAWYGNLTSPPDDSPGSFAAQRVISTTLTFPASVHTADLDGDGDLDVLSASTRDDKIARYENLTVAPDSSPGAFSSQQVISTGADNALSVYAVDLDNDGDADVLSASRDDDKIAWYENLAAAPASSPGTFSSQQVISTAADGACSVHATDLDGDGDSDVLSASHDDNKIAWYENLTAAPDNSPGTFSSQQVITTAALGAVAVHAADLDGDGDTDVVSASFDDATVAWYENLTAAPDNNPGTFSAGVPIADTVITATSVYAADLDGDGDPDVLWASRDMSQVAWHENLTAPPDSSPGGFLGPQVLTTEARGARKVRAADLDGDGDMDVLSVSSGDGKVAWYENLSAAPDSSAGVFLAQQIIASISGACTVHAADLDGDGDLDVISSSWDNDGINWHENLGDPCAPTPCSHGGVCAYLNPGFACDCSGSGYTGPTCEIDVDECAVDNGNCGDAAYWLCTNNIGAAPTCTDLDECLVDNGDCGDPSFWHCTNNAGAPPTCDDIDECLVDNGDCGDPSFWHCTNNAGAPPTCDDIDECLVDNGDCGDPSFWHCTNNAGAPPTCDDLDECLVDNGDCGDPSFWHCTNNAGAPPTCDDIDECLVDNGDCGDPSFWHCTNNAGAPPTCDDIDECLVDNGDCGDPSFWHCTNNAGAPPTCDDLDECLVDNGDCGDPSFWHCTNNAGAPPTCDDIDECLVDNGDCGDPSFWHCTNNAGAPPTCDDIDECASASNVCDVNATCTNSDGGYSCACRIGFAGDGRTCARVRTGGGLPRLASGCSCGASGVSGSPFLFGSMLFGPLAWRRRRARIKHVGRRVRRIRSAS